MVIWGLELEWLIVCSSESYSSRFTSQCCQLSCLSPRFDTSTCDHYFLSHYSAVRITWNTLLHIAHLAQNLTHQFSSVQFSSATRSCPTLWDPMNRSMPGLPVHHHLPEFTQTHVHPVRAAIQASHPRSSPSPPDPNPSQHQSLFQWVNCSHEVAKVLEFQL